MRFLIVLMMIAAGGCGYGIKSAEGKKIGQVVKLGEYGLLCSTYEGELVRGGLSGGSGVNGTAFHFTVPSKELYEKLLPIMEAQQEIEVSYTKATLTGPCSSEGNSEAFVTGFRVLGPTNNEAEKQRKRDELQRQLKALD